MIYQTQAQKMKLSKELIESMNEEQMRNALLSIHAEQILKAQAEAEEQAKKEAEEKEASAMLDNFFSYKFNENTPH